MSRKRAKQIAWPITNRLQAGGVASFRANLGELTCCKGFESVCGAPAAKLSKGVRLATARTVKGLSRFYFDLDEGVVSESDPDTFDRLFQETNPAEQMKVLALFRRPLGKRTSLPEDCRSSAPPHAERFDLVWAVRERDVFAYDNSADSLRDALGLVHFYAGDKVVCFNYTLPGYVSAFIPTAVEAMGGWAFLPGTRGEGQKTMNYRTGEVGCHEFVHSAEIEPDRMQYHWVGKLARNWDDEPDLHA